MTDQPLPDIPGFDIRRLLGEGHSGRVYLADAHDPELPEQVALKVLRERDQLRETEIRRFLREGRLGSRLTHPHILPVYRLIEWQDTFVLVMQLAEGQTFQHWQPCDDQGRPLRGAALLETRLTALGKIARALDAAHRAGIVHRDVKPANIQVRHDGEPFLIDFGLAREELHGATLTPSHVLMGTPLYMAPELIAGRAHHVDARCDVYGLGVTLYEAIAGHPPFSGESREELWQQVLHVEPPRLAGQVEPLPQGLEAVTLRALEKNPLHRQGSAGELAGSLERIVRGLSPEQSSVGLLLRRRWRSLLRQRLAIAATVALVLALSTWTFADRWQTTRIESALQSGDRALDNGDLTSALQHYDRALAEAPDRPAAYLRRAAAYSNFELLDSAASQVERAIELGYYVGQPGARDARQHFYAGLQIAYLFGAREGVRELALAVSADPNGYDVYGPLFQLQRGLGQLDQAALTLVSWSSNLKGKDPRSALVAALTFETAGDIPSAIATLLALGQDSADEPQADSQNFWRHRNLGRLYISSGQFDAAESSLRRAVRIVPQDAISWHNLATVAFRRGDIDHAAELALDALTLSPRLVPAILLLASCAQTRGRLALAVERLDTHGFAGPGSERLQTMRSDLLYAIAQEHDLADECAAAREARRRCVQANPEHIGAITDLAFESWIEGDYAAGYQGFTQARELWWRHPQAASGNADLWRQAYGNPDDLLDILVGLFACAGHCGQIDAALAALGEFDEQSARVADVQLLTRLNLAEALATLPPGPLRDCPRAMALIDSAFFDEQAAVNPQVADVLALIRAACR